MSATDEEATMKTLPRHTITRPALAALAAAVALAAGCGGDDDRLSKDETAKEVNAAVQTVNGEFQQAFQLLGRREEGERVPSAVRARLSRAATVERREAGKLDSIEPPAEAEEAVDGFVRAARSQADTLKSAAARTDLTVAEMADALEPADVREALAELERQGLAKAPPRHQ
jgi:hypothetical protein